MMPLQNRTSLFQALRSSARRPLHAVLEALFRLTAHFPVIDPLGRGLSRRRRAIIAELLPAARARLLPLRDGVLSGDCAAVAAYDQGVHEILGRLRVATAAASGVEASRITALLGVLDFWLYRNGEELVDDVNFPLADRLQIMEVLNQFNLHLGSYRRWCERLQPLVTAAAARTHKPVQIHDLAAGHGGFAIAVKEYFGARVAVTASDLRQEYLELGRPQAHTRGVEVHFVEQDATRLANLGDSGVDLFVCTQSVHHFPPGMVARMLGEATRAARTGVCFIDGERGYFPLLLVPLMGAYAKTFAASHDTWVSLRRMYLAEELELLAQLAPAMPPSAHIAADREGPGHTLLTITV